MTAQERNNQALSRAKGGLSTSNYAVIYTGLEAKGIPQAEIEPRVNVLTFHAWKAVGRRVKKGERGVKVFTYAPITKTVEDPETGEKRTVTIGKRPWSTTVFHVTQTQEA